MLINIGQRPCCAPIGRAAFQEAKAQRALTRRRRSDGQLRGLAGSVELGSQEEVGLGGGQDGLDDGGQCKRRG